MSLYWYLLSLREASIALTHKEAEDALIDRFLIMMKKSGQVAFPHAKRGTAKTKNETKSYCSDEHSNILTPNYK